MYNFCSASPKFVPSFVPGGSDDGLSAPNQDHTLHVTVLCDLQVRVITQTVLLVCYCIFFFLRRLFTVF
jgi:hypothetical protein